MIQPRLSPKARELLRRLEEREAKGKASQDKPSTPGAKKGQPKTFVGLGPNPLDYLK